MNKETGKPERRTLMEDIKEWLENEEREPEFELVSIGEEDVKIYIREPEQIEVIPLSEAFEFAQWLDLEDWSFVHTIDKWSDGEDYKTDSELYDQFKEHKTKE